MATRRRAHLVNVVNRTTKPLGATRDGIPYVLHPGYIAVDKDGIRVELEENTAIPRGVRVVPAKAVKDRRGNVISFQPVLDATEDTLPYFEQFEWAVARAACLQNKRTGTENSQDPREFESLCGVLEWENDIEHCEQADGEMFDQSTLPDDARNRRKIGQPKGKRSKKSRRFHIEQYGGGYGNPTGMYIPDGRQPGH